MTVAINEKVFLTRTNTNTLTHKTGGADTVWTGISYMVLDLIALDDGNADVQLATNVGGQENTVNFSSNGFLIFTLGDQAVAEGSYLVELTGVDGSSNKTQIIHPDREYTGFKFVSTQTVS